MNNKDLYIKQLKSSLKDLNPYLILLFGSYAYGTPDEHSDFDILVVTNDNSFPKTYAEKSKIYQSINRAIRPLKEQVAVDLLVYTRPMYKRFIELDSLFAREILSKAEIIYENDN